MNPLSEKLKALADFDPPPGGWERLVCRLDRQKRSRRAVYAGLALAASLLLAMGLALLRPAVPVPARGQGADDLAQLMLRSRELEQTLLQVRPRVLAWDNTLASEAARLENDLAVVDLQLNYAGPEGARRLWKNRVELMSQLVQTHEQAAALSISFNAQKEISL